jgi:hypothetical protein
MDNDELTHLDLTALAVHRWVPWLLAAAIALGVGA